MKGGARNVSDVAWLLGETGGSLGMLMVNRGSASVSLTNFGIEGRLEPGKTAELPDGYCLPRLYLNGSRQPSIVEELCPALQPADPADAAEVKETPAAPFVGAPSPEAVAAELTRSGKPPAVVALLAQGRAEARQGRAKLARTFSRRETPPPSPEPDEGKG